MIRTYLKQKQSGRSMIEMLGVLAIVGVLSAGGIAGYSMAMQSYKTNALIEKVQLIATRARSTYKGNYVGLNLDNMVAIGKIPDKNNPFGGVFNAGCSGSGSIPETFWLATGDSNIPAESCVDILTADWGGKSVFIGFLIDQTVELSYNSGKYPMTTQQAISACNGGNKKMQWWFTN